MKKKLFLIPCLALGICAGTTSCMGSFGLLNKFASWNQGATGNKFVNGFIGILLPPTGLSSTPSNSGPAHSLLLQTPPSAWWAAMEMFIS